MVSNALDMLLYVIGVLGLIDLMLEPLLDAGDDDSVGTDEAGPF